MPSLVPSNSETWLSTMPEGRLSRSTTKPWFCEVISTFEVSPEDAGLPISKLKDLLGGDAETNALALNALLDGHESAYRDIVILNAAAALITAGVCDYLEQGAEMAAKSIDSGAARKVLEKLIEVSNEVLPEPEEDEEGLSIDGKDRE